MGNTLLYTVLFILFDAQNTSDETMQCTVVYETSAANTGTESMYEYMINIVSQTKPMSHINCDAQ